ncbi:MAG: hypothetical protein IKU45_02055 [Clostridia bacterium]|nr:hypothetical protein [Clostridia bacterium]
MGKEQILEMLMSAVAVEVKSEGAEEPRFPYLLIPHNGDDVKFLELTKSQVELFKWLFDECLLYGDSLELLSLSGDAVRWEKP